MPSAIKIKSYKIGKAGGRGLKIGLPSLWIDDLMLRAGDKVDLYRDTDDRLIIVKSGTPFNTENSAIYRGKTQIDAEALQ